MQAKTVSESLVVMQHAPMPDETNTAGFMHGGHLLKHIDTAAGVAAWRHARCRVVTVSIERMDFLAPIRLEQLLTLTASVNMVGKSSIAVGVRVEAEDLNSGETRHAATCYMTYVAVDENGRPKAVDPLAVETEDEIRRQSKARERRLHRERVKAG